MPSRQARSSAHGRPPRECGRRFGKKGAIRAHGTSGRNGIGQVLQDYLPPIYRLNQAPVVKPVLVTSLYFLRLRQPNPWNAQHH
jgi:hypothetical protein